LRKIVLLPVGRTEGTRCHSEALREIVCLLLLEKGHCLRDQALSVLQYAVVSPAAGVLTRALCPPLFRWSSVRIGVTLIPECPWRWITRLASVSVALSKPAPLVRNHRILWRKPVPGQTAPQISEWFVSPPTPCADSTAPRTVSLKLPELSVSQLGVESDGVFGDRMVRDARRCPGGGLSPPP